MLEVSLIKGKGKGPSLI